MPPATHIPGATFYANEAGAFFSIKAALGGQPVVLRDVYADLRRNRRAVLEAVAAAVGITNAHRLHKPTLVLAIEYACRGPLGHGGPLVHGGPLGRFPHAPV
jgi:hypothetical protein